MKNEGNFPKRPQKPVHETENQSTAGTPPNIGRMQSDPVFPSRKKELKRDDHLPPAAGEYERYHPKEEPASPSGRAPLSIIEKERNPERDETNTNSTTPPDMEQE
ncbi:hypothetical protein MKY41_09475 [Sporosarcina sp. FSL W7-1349]|uniref:hypothetical protein n=1 Tax=Sporosarcina sp. FSL W7-1349 TaxID=2921561 RepID=UPI0030F601E8